MSLDARLINDEGDVGKFTQLEHLQHVPVQVCLGHLHPNVKHPDVIKGELAIVPPKHVQLALDYVRGVAAAGPRAEVARLDLLPVILLDVEHVHVVHPVGAIVPPKVVNLRIHQAPGRGNSGGRLLARDGRLDPGEGARVQVKNVIKLAILVRLAAKYVDLLLICDG